MSREAQATARRRRPRAGAIVGLLLLAMVLGAVVLTDPDGRSEPPLSPVSVWLDARHPGRPVPRRFLGLSFEISSIGQLAAMARQGNLVTLLRSLGPGVLRFGGVSADTRVAWIDRATRQAAWASSTLDIGQLRMLRALAERSGWRVLLTLGLAHYDPAAAAREAAAASAALGPWLAGVELGNEPDAYGRHGFRSALWRPAAYALQVAHYRKAIARLVPGLAIVGPDVSGSRAFAPWARAEIRDARPVLLTGHHYPLGCHETPPPSIERLLSPLVQQNEQRSLARFMAVSLRSGIHVRMDEANTVSCGGVAGVSDTFASALWGVGYIANAMAAGVSGINLHGNVERCDGYSPLCAATPEQIARGALGVRPDWYALLLASALIGDRPLATAIAAPQHPNMTIVALRTRTGALHFVIVDRDPPGSPAVALSLHVGAGYRAARVLALTGPGPGATAGVELGGVAVAPDGSWRPPPHLPQVPVRDAVLPLTVPPSSAALVSVERVRETASRRAPSSSTQA